MGKVEFLDALKRAMPGLPPETQARTLAYYEQRFVDGVAAGQSEDEVARTLDAPSKIAMTLRTSAHLDTLAAPRRAAHGVRVLLSALGLALFNLFMLVPAAVFAALLLTVYASALSFYVGGIAVTASALAGANEVVLRAPLRELGVYDARQTRITIGANGIEVHDEADPHSVEDDSDEPRVLRGAEAVAGRGIHLSTSLEDGSRGAQSAFGLAMVVGGILLFLISLVVSRYTVIGMKRYVQMNLSVLRGG